MRLQKHLRTLATATTAAAILAPAAHAYPIGTGGGGSMPLAHPHVVSTSHHLGSSDWGLIALTGGGTAALIGAGLGGSRRINRRRTSAASARAPHVA